MLSLSKALKENRLEEFIRQQEAAGVGPVNEAVEGGRTCVKGIIPFKISLKVA